MIVVTKQNTPQPLYNTVHYNMVLDITWFKDGSQKCKDNLYIFVFDNHMVVLN